MSSSLYLNNVRVNGIVPNNCINIWYLLGVLNGPVCDFVFRRIAKPKSGNYFEANKQFIELLPIPKADKDQQKLIAELAERLQRYYTDRSKLLHKIDQRMSTLNKKSKSVNWLFPDLPTKQTLLEDAPKKLNDNERKVWAQERFNKILNDRFQTLGDLLRPGVIMEAKYDLKELQFLVNDSVALDKIYVDYNEGAFIEAQWNFIAQTYSVTEKTDGKVFSNALRKLCTPSKIETVKQIIALQQEISSLIERINQNEFTMNKHLYKLYRLKTSDIERINAG